MKELAQIIEALHGINQQMIEKDNMIDHYTVLINLFHQLVTDESFTRSDIYLDLRAKYLASIEEKLRLINDAATKVVIEPQNPINVTTTTKPADKKQFVAAEVTAPIPTNIYAAPGSRRQFTKPKAPPKKKTTNPKDPTLPIETEDPEYVHFTYNQQDYYLELIDTAAGQAGPKQATLFYDRYLRLAGNLQEPTLTLLRS